MLTRLEYLKKCITSGKVIETMDWYVSCFAVPHLSATPDWEKDPSLYRIVPQPDGLYFIDHGEDHRPVLVKLSDHKRDQPLFTFQETVQVDASWLPTITTPTETKIGVLIINALVFYPTLGMKQPYLNAKMKVSDIEGLFVNRVKNDDVATDKDLRVSEMVACIDRLTFLSNLATIVSIAATPKAITPPPGIAKLKKELLKEYADQLHDPVKVVELENKLGELDKAYLADDPAANNIFNNKSRTARKKMYLMFGETMDFTEGGDSKVVVPSLSEGIDTSEDVFPLYMNDLRAASFSRGSSTALSGYSYKILQRSLSGLTISPTPCNTTRGLVRAIDKGSYKKLVGRYVRDKGWLLVDDSEKAKQYIDKTVEMRSTMYCTSPGNTVCYQCVSENYRDNVSGVTNIASELSATLMRQFLKKIHGGITEVAVVNITDLCS